MGRPGPQERRRGYHRTRPDPEPTAFALNGHAFETDGKHLWVTPPGSDRIDRIKVSRYLGDRSARRGYPRELIRPEPLTGAWAHAAAAFWLRWSATAAATEFPPVFVDHHIRQREQRQLLPA